MSWGGILMTKKYFWNIGWVALPLTLAGCAGPTSPFGGVNPWDLVNHADTLIPSDESTQVQASPIERNLSNAQWEYLKAQQQPDKPWVLMEPREINYINPVVLRIYIHDPQNHGQRPRIRLTYDDWDLTSKIKNKDHWQKISTEDWQFTSSRIKFSPSRIGELKVSFHSHSSHQWVSNQLVEPHCAFDVGDTPLENQYYALKGLQQTGRFQVEPALLAKIENLAWDQKLNPNLLAALIAQESAFNPRAVSMAKAIGLTQITPMAEVQISNVHPEFPRFPGLNQFSFMRLMTLVKMQEIGPEQEWRLDPEQSIRGGITYLNMVRNYWNKVGHNRIPAALQPSEKSLNQQEVLALTLASYNSGPSRIRRAYLQSPKNWLKDDNLQEARTYVHKISSYCANFSGQPSRSVGEK